jgi:matrixin
MTPRSRLTVVACAVALSALVWPRAASAFCRTTTVPVAPDFQPRPDKCWEQGVPLFWRNSCVSYSVQRGASRQVAFDEAANGISRAFTKWTGSACPTEGSGRSRVSIDVRDLGAVDCADVNYNQEGGNQNVIVFRDEKWPHNDSNNTLALTTVTFNPENGEIYDADMEVNTHDQRVTLIDPVPQDGYDFASIVTHETGHFLGLAHSGDNRATMFANYTPGATAMRNLTSDDVAGVCEIYRPDGTRAVLNDKVTPGPQCDPTPRRGFTGECAEPESKNCLGGSHVAVSSRVTPGAIGAVLALGALAVMRRRRRL